MENNKMIKKPEEIALIRQGGLLLGGILETVAGMVKPGVTTEELDREAERLIRAVGGRPSFKGYNPGGTRPFPSTLCISLNHEVVHAPATPARTIKKGDLVSLDIGMEWNKLYTDTALTVAVGGVPPRAQELLSVTYESLLEGIKQCVPGNSIADIGRAIESYIAPHAFGIVKVLVGHGVGYKVHEPPQIPNYFVRANRSIILKQGMVLALEPMVNIGTDDVDTLDDDWTIVTADQSLSAHFEHTIVVTDGAPEVLTKRPGEVL